MLVKLYMLAKWLRSVQSSRPARRALSSRWSRWRGPVEFVAAVVVVEALAGLLLFMLLLRLFDPMWKYI
ncbi:hypothetical protein EVC30_057 [Rhizobium phage RHph_Y1_11]|nr:hypothetical protein EVC30_057 [Rhizobium phage RHph_Y1_11]